MIPTREINGIRSSPLKIHHDSNLIKKPTTLSATTSASTASHRHPVIVYTHSPKIFHIQACDFMSLVQRLTGFSGSYNDDNNNSIPPSPYNKRRKNSIGKKNEELVKSSSDHTVLQLMPQQWPSVAPAATNSYQFNPPSTSSNLPSFMQGFTSEFFDLPNSIYKCTDFTGVSSISNMNSFSSRFSDT